MIVNERLKIYGDPWRGPDFKPLSASVYQALGR
jgi:hypothetical protein